MPYPERLLVWTQEHPENSRIVHALLCGAVAGTKGEESLGVLAAKFGYTARSPQGDAFEEGYLFASEQRHTNP